MSPISPLLPYISAGTTVCPPPPNPGGFSSSLSHSRTSSFSSIGPFQRPESTGSLAALRNAAAGNYASSVFTGSEAGDTRERDAGYVSDGDRPPGQPLFPSNFARLTMGRANDSAFKSMGVPLRAKYISGSGYISPGDEAKARSDAGARVGGITMAAKRQSWGADG